MRADERGGLMAEPAGRRLLVVVLVLDLALFREDPPAVSNHRGSRRPADSMNRRSARSRDTPRTVAHAHRRRTVPGRCTTFQPHGRQRSHASSNRRVSVEVQRAGPAPSASASGRNHSSDSRP